MSRRIPVPPSHTHPPNAQPENIAAWNCTRCWRVPGFQAAAMIHDKEQELLAYTGYLPDKNSIIIVFRCAPTSIPPPPLPNPPVPLPTPAHTHPLAGGVA